MIVVIDSLGFTMSKRKGRIAVTYVYSDRKVTKEFAISNITAIVISSSGSISTKLLKEIASHNIPIIFTSSYAPFGVFHPYFMHATVVTRREQMRALSDSRGLLIAKAFVRAAMINKVRVLRYFAESRRRSDPGLAELLNSHADRIEELLPYVKELNGDLDSLRVNLMGYEGEATQIYYDALTQLFDPELGFRGRDRRPPRDPVNSVLSYGYTILNSIVHLAIAKVGLEPFAGFLHVDRSGKPSLILDLSEEFRQPIIDVVVTSLFSKGVLKLNHFSFEDDGRCFIGKEGKSIFFNALESRLKSNTPSPYAKRTTFEHAIMLQARGLARFLIGRAIVYKPFIWRWW